MTGKRAGARPGAWSLSLPALLALLDVPVEDAAWQALDPPQRRQRTLDAVKRLLLRESQVQPLLSSSRTCTGSTPRPRPCSTASSRACPRPASCSSSTTAPSIEHGWGSKTYYRQLRLDPLPAESAEELLDALLGHDPSSDPLKQTADRADGGQPASSSRRACGPWSRRGRWPASAGAYRLDAAAGALAGPGHGAGDPGRAHRPPGAGGQAPAPGGRRHRQGRALAAAPGDRGRAGGGRCARGSPISRPRSSSTRRGLFPDLEYTFKHALTHEVAYGSLLHERRRALHARIVEAIERLLRRRLAEQVERLAHHAAAGRAVGEGGRLLRQAGRQGRRRARPTARPCLLRAGARRARAVSPRARRRRAEPSTSGSTSGTRSSRSAIGADRGRTSTRRRRSPRRARRPAPARARLALHGRPVPDHGRLRRRRRVGAAGPGHRASPRRIARSEVVRRATSWPDARTPGASSATPSATCERNVALEGTCAPSASGRPSSSVGRGGLARRRARPARAVRRGPRARRGACGSPKRPITLHAVSCASLRLGCAPPRRREISPTRDPRSRAGPRSLPDGQIVAAGHRSSPRPWAPPTPSPAGVTRRSPLVEERRRASAAVDRLAVRRPCARRWGGLPLGRAARRGRQLRARGPGAHPPRASAGSEAHALRLLGDDRRHLDPATPSDG